MMATNPRRGGLIFIEKVAKRLWGTGDPRIMRRILWSGLVFFHKYFDAHRLDEDDVEVLGMVCVLLAGKTEDGVKSIKAVIDAAHPLLRNGQPIAVGATVRQHLGRPGRRKAGWRVVALDDGPPSVARGQFTSKDGSVVEVVHPTSFLEVVLDQRGEAFARMKEQILDGERRLLNALGFDIDVVTAHKAAIKLIRERVDFLPAAEAAAAAAAAAAPAAAAPAVGKKLKPARGLTAAKKKVGQLCFDFINDSLFTSLYLQFSPQAIAFGALCLAWQRETEGAESAEGPPADASASASAGSATDGAAPRLPQPRERGASASAAASASASAATATAATSAFAAWQRGFELQPSVVPAGDLMYIARRIAEGAVMRLTSEEAAPLSAIFDTLLESLRTQLRRVSRGDFPPLALDESGQYAGRWTRADGGDGDGDADAGDVDAVAQRKRREPKSKRRKASPST